MVEFINESVSVELQARQDGTGRPVAFVWRGRRHQITSWGRETTETEEGRTLRCLLVQTAGPETWELCQDTETAQWTITRHWTTKHHVV